MSLAEGYLNDQTRMNPKLYKDCGGTKLESVAFNVLKAIAPSTPFRPENISLISGVKFPDIIAENYYGIEVKSTKEDSWKSIGSSIVENTRIESITNIYMLFGKLGGQRAEFKCLPYEDCLCNIAVTHSPRYLIDMQLKENMNPTIFEKIGMSYENFRLKDEIEKIDSVRHYYKEKAKAEGKVEMPWWMGNSASSVTLSFFNDLDTASKELLKVRMWILFPEILSSNTNERISAFKRAALWLCNRHSLLCYNVRDLFTSGGQYIVQNNPKIIVPGSFGKLIAVKNEVEYLLKNPDYDLLEDINEYWDVIGINNNYYDFWLGHIADILSKDNKLSALNIKELLLT